MINRAGVNYRALTTDPVFLNYSVEMEEDEVGILIASADVSASCAFKFDEWEKFLAGINKADEILKKRFERL